MSRVVCLVAESAQTFRGDMVSQLARVIGSAPPINRAFFSPVGTYDECAWFAGELLTEEGPACTVNVVLQMRDESMLAVRFSLSAVSDEETAKLKDLWDSCMIV